jgi:hypothetical protein
MKERNPSRISKVCENGFLPTMAALTSSLAAIAFMEGAVPVSVTFLTAAALSIIGTIASRRFHR